MGGMLQTPARSCSRHNTLAASQPGRSRASAAIAAATSAGERAPTRWVSQFNCSESSMDIDSIVPPFLSPGYRRIRFEPRPDPAYAPATVRHSAGHRQAAAALTCPIDWAAGRQGSAHTRRAPAPHRVTDLSPRMLADSTKDAIRAAYARVKAGLPGFRARASQGRMIAEVAKALASAGGVAVIEAPTGTGKSMAYLVAGHEVARFQKKKLLIATATVALQEQLVQRDIPLYLKLNDIEAKVALAKGRGRYLCPRNLLMAANSIHDAQLGLAGFEADLLLWNKPPQPRDKQSLAKLRDAFDRGEWNGDMDSAPEPVSDLLRPMITTSAGGCTGRKCGQFMNCPFFAARRAVDDADIIVANQDLVLADLTMPGEDDSWGGVILPRPDETLYIFDEGHHVPGKAIERGAAEVFMTATVRQLSRLGRQVHAAYSLTDKERLGKLALDQGDEKLQELSNTLEELEKEIRLAWLPDPAETEPMYRGSLGQLPEPWVEHARALDLLTGEVQRWLTAVRRAVVEMTDGGPTQEALSRELGIALERIGR